MVRTVRDEPLPRNKYYATSEADVNGDGKVGFEGMFYICKRLTT